MNKTTLAKEIKSAVEWLKKEDCGCSTNKLDEKLAICVGWSEGYDVNDKDAIHSRENPTWCINVGIKVWTSDMLRTDYNFINSPYYENGEVWDTDCTISFNENYNMLTDYLLQEYENLSKFEIEDDGKIIKHKNLWVCEHCLRAIESREGTLETCMHNENQLPCDWCGENNDIILYELI